MTAQSQWIFAAHDKGQRAHQHDVEHGENNTTLPVGKPLSHSLPLMPELTEKLTHTLK
jgi:hypothetical protein